MSQGNTRQTGRVTGHRQDPQPHVRSQPQVASSTRPSGSWRDARYKERSPHGALNLLANWSATLDQADPDRAPNRA